VDWGGGELGKKRREIEERNSQWGIDRKGLESFNTLEATLC